MESTRREHHDGGLEHDLQLLARQLGDRRCVLRWLAGGITGTLLGACGGSDSGGSSTAATAASSSGSTGSSAGTGTSTTACIADPAETNGPFPADGTNTVNGSTVNVLTQSGIVRSDITSSFGSSTNVAPGVPLTLIITLEDPNTACELLLDYAIYIWHCNRDGNYSLYSAAVTNENYLRGVQATDSNGQVTFKTMFPACYSGRYPHIHVEVYPSLAKATQQSNALITTQLAMPRDVCQTVYSTAIGYSQSVTNLAQVTTSSDNVFNSSTTAQIAAQTPTFSGDVTSGYTATVTIGVAV